MLILQSLAITNLSFFLAKMAQFKVIDLNLESTKIIEENVDETILEKLRTGIPLKLTGIP